MWPYRRRNRFRSHHQHLSLYRLYHTGFAMNNEGIVDTAKQPLSTENSENNCTYDEPTVRGNYAVVTAEVTDAGTSA